MLKPVGTYGANLIIEKQISKLYVPINAKVSLKYRYTKQEYCKEQIEKINP